ncbi:MAG TPA: carbonic anhydrase [Thermomicrobiales bacterium]|nr:carbonic anhydrase [Thermomicrobiales bacterium]
MTEIESFLNANDAYAVTFAHGDLPMPPARKVAILTCMDARLDPAKMLGLQEGDAHVIRNAGGRASIDALRSLIISQQLLGTREVVVIHHTDCGMLTFTNDALRSQLRERFEGHTSDMDFLPFSDVEQSVRDDVEAIRNDRFIPNDIPVSGFVYDVTTGRLSRVV